VGTVPFSVSVLRDRDHFFPSTLDRDFFSRRNGLRGPIEERTPPAFSGDPLITY